MLNYPAPRYPRLKRPKSIDELMFKARELMNQPTGQHYKVLKPGYGIKAGDKVLFTVLNEYNPMVVEAMVRAMKEKGALVDVFTRECPCFDRPEDVGLEEAVSIGEEDEHPSFLFAPYINRDVIVSLHDMGRYDIVIGGSAGPDFQSVSFPWYPFNLYELEDFACAAIDFPADVQKLIDDKLCAQIKSCQVLRLTDPEGTDIKWTNYDDGRPCTSGHQLARPINTGYGNDGKDDCAGVISGTLNHQGAFPYCRAYIERGRVVNVEGGGKYGEVWRQKLEKYKDVKLPRLPARSSREPFPSPTGDDPMYELSDPGIFWYWECAIGTWPWIFRLPQEGRLERYNNLIRDRRRSGYIHNGFGPNLLGEREMKKAGLPWMHLHIHSMFATLEGKTSKGENITLIDKGHLTALDDPEVRALASKYGNPDELLTEAWIPAIPGINVPGNYMKDYAQDPISWMRKEAGENPIWID